MVFIRNEPWDFPFGFDLDNGCDEIGPSCGAVTGFVLSWLSLAGATALFLVHRRKAVHQERRRLPGRNHTSWCRLLAASPAASSVGMNCARSSSTTCGWRRTDVPN